MLFTRQIQPMITPTVAPDVREESARSAALTSRAFIMAVALLLLNDRVLKPEFSNWWTGKLSDFAGLFAFSVFWAALFPRHRRPLFALTALGFVLWKSPLSDAPLAAWNALGLWPLVRVVDYTDWLALAALVPAYGLEHRRGPPLPLRPRRLLRHVGAIVTAVIAALAFAATSVAPPSYPVPDATPYIIPASIGEVLSGLDTLGLSTVKRSSFGRQSGPAADTLRVYIRQPPERMVGVTMELRERLPGETALVLLSVSAPGPEPRPESIHRAFREQVFDPLRAWLARRRAPNP